MTFILGGLGYLLVFGVLPGYLAAVLMTGDWQPWKRDGEA